MELQLAQVEAFVETARRRNVSRAAEALYVSQPALTARLKALERELDAPLFVRTGRGVRLTEVGREFLPYAERVLATLSDGRRRLADVRAGGAGELVIGAAPTISTYVLPAVLRRFQSVHPGAALSVRAGHSEDVLGMVLREEVQVGLARAIRHPEVNSMPFFEDEIVLVVDRKHPFASQDRVRLESVAAERIILFDRASSYHELTSALFRQAGVVPRAVMELDDVAAAKKMVEHGLGLALLPRAAVAAELRRGSLHAVKIAGAPVFRRRIVALRRKDAGRPTALLAAFLAMLEELRDAAPSRSRSSDRYSRRL
jgi:DNA-binding transcriptional LysR family regulator